MDKFLQKSWSNWVITGPLVQVHRKYNIPFFNFFRKSQGGLHQQIVNSMDGKKKFTCMHGRENHRPKHVMYQLKIKTSINQCERNA